MRTAFGLRTIIEIHLNFYKITINMRKFLLPALLAVLCLGVNAQSKKAPNYYRAIPKVHTHRLAQWSTFGGSEVFNYKYDDYGFLTEVESTEDDKLTEVIKFAYDSNGYLKEETRYTVKPDGGQRIDRRDVYDRDDNGFIKTYHRYTLKPNKEGNLVLMEDVRSTYVYDAQMRVIKTNDVQFDEKNLKLEDFADRHTTIAYDDKGREQTFSFMMSNGNNVWKEVFEYDNNIDNRMVGLKYIPGEEATDRTTMELKYVYDDNGDIKNTGTEDFPYTFSYGEEGDEQYEAAHTFIPLTQSEGDRLYLGPRNCLYFNHLPLNKAFKHAPMSESTDDTECSYEENTAVEKKTDGIAEITHDQANISFSNGCLIIEGATNNGTEQVCVYSVTGQLVATHAVRGNKTIFLNTLPAGEYIAKIGRKVVKFSKS